MTGDVLTTGGKVITNGGLVVTDKACICGPAADEFGSFQYFQTFLGSSVNSETHCGGICENVPCDPTTHEPCADPDICFPVDCCTEGPNSGEAGFSASFHVFGTGTIVFGFNYSLSPDTAPSPCAQFVEGDGFVAHCDIQIRKEGASDYVTLDFVSSTNMTRVTGNYWEQSNSLIGSGAVEMGLDFADLEQGCKYIIEVADGAVSGVNNVGSPSAWSLVSPTNAGLVLACIVAGSCCVAGDGTLIYVP